VLQASSLVLTAAAAVLLCVDVAVKILTDVGAAGSRLSGGDANCSTATWDKVRLEKLLHEVGVATAAAAAAAAAAQQYASVMGLIPCRLLLLLTVDC
jgi:hypothetical protein